MLHPCVCVCFTGSCVWHVFSMFVLYVVALFSPLLTHIQCASKFPSSSIMDQEMFYLLVLAHLSKRASNSLGMSWHLSQREGMEGGPQRRGRGPSRAAQILISGAVFELALLCRSFAHGTRRRVEKATQQRGRELAGLSDSGRFRLVAAASIAAAVLGERAEHHLCIDILLSSARIRVPVDEPRVDG